MARGPYHGLYIISIHAPLAGRDVARLAERMDRTYFNPRAPCGARQQAVRYSVSYISFQSTRPLRGATRDLVGCSGRVGISIHAPLAGRDRPGSALQSPCCYFNPRAPCGARLRVHSDASGFAVDFNPRAPCGARRLDRLRTVQRHRFQSTRPLRGATLQRCCSAVPTCDFNPRAPCGARPAAAIVTTLADDISIHAPLAGRDSFAAPAASGAYGISIHAPLAGRDMAVAHPMWLQAISIHAPLAGRDSAVSTVRIQRQIFQSTRPLRGATCFRLEPQAL